MIAAKSNDLLESPDTENVDDTGDSNEEVLHYVRQDQITKSLVEGDHVVALCGETFQVTRTKGLPICKDCKRIHDRMKP